MQINLTRKNKINRQDKKAFAIIKISSANQT